MGFVDDTNCHTNDFLNDDQHDLEALLYAAKADAQLWADLLWTSGGYLELSKCSYHFIHFSFTSEGAPVLVYQDSEELQLTIEDTKTKKETPIRNLSPYTPYKTLGHFKSPGGAPTRQKQELLNKCNRLPGPQD